MRTRNIKNRVISLTLCLVMMLSTVASTGLVSFAIDVAPAEAEYEHKDYRLQFDVEAPFGNEYDISFLTNVDHTNDGWERWSMPIGNGYGGAVVFGRTETERVQLTEKTYGNCYYHYFEGVGNKSLGGIQNFADLYLDFGHSFDEVTNYYRYLDLATGVIYVEYVYEGVKYTREYFMSYPDQAVVIKLGTSVPGTLDVTVRPEIPYLGHVYKELNGKPVDDGALRTGELNAYVDGTNGIIDLGGHLQYYNITCAGQFKVIPEGQSSSISAYNDPNAQTAPKDDEVFYTGKGSTVTVNDADSVVLMVTMTTDYTLAEEIFTTEDHSQKIDALKAAGKYVSAEDKLTAILNGLEGKSYEALKATHIADHGEIFNRVTFDLGGESSLMTDELVNTYGYSTGANGEYTDSDHKRDLYLEEILFAYGRYLQIASSRENTLPSNLQGTWTRYQLSPWGCGMWHNINEQQNYWAAFTTNMSETFESYINYWYAYLPQAQKTTSSMVQGKFPNEYDPNGENGWSIVTGASAYYVNSQQSLGNLGLTLPMFWDYYEYSGDREKLQTAFEALYGAASFMTKAVVYVDGLYLSANGDSAEQYVNGQWYYTQGTTYDQAALYYVGSKTLEAAELLGYTAADYPVLATIAEQIDKYDYSPIGYSGQLKEFREEDYYGDLGEWDHRHISQLIGLYPGDVINSNTPAWLDAAKYALIERDCSGQMKGAHGVVHRLPAWARVKDGENAYLMVKDFIDVYVATNLWNCSAMWQIDGNLGYTGGLVEMILQSHEGYIEVIPAIPDAWSTGSFSGMVARGNFEVSASWTDGLTEQISILSNNGGEARVKLQNSKGVKVWCDGKAVSYTDEGNDIISFNTEEGKTYIISGFTAKSESQAPASFEVKDQTGLNVTLGWTASNTATSYNLYKASGSDAAYTFIASVPAGTTSYTYTLANSNEFNERRTYRITAVNADGVESEALLCYTVPTIENATATLLPNGKVEISAYPEEDYSVVGYSYYIKKAGSNEYTLLADSEYPVYYVDNHKDGDTYGVVLHSHPTEHKKNGITVGDRVITSPIMPLNPNKGASGNALENKLMGLEDGFAYLGGTKRNVKNLTDGNKQTGFTSYAISGTNAISGNVKTMTLYANLEGMYYYSYLRIYDKEFSTESHVESVKIETYYQGAWTTVGTYNPTADDNLYFDVDLTGVKGSRIRLTVTGTTNSFTLYEIELSASPHNEATNPTDVYQNNLLLGNKAEVVDGSAHSVYTVEALTDGNFHVHGGRFSSLTNSVTLLMDLGGYCNLDTLTIHDFYQGGTTINEFTVEIWNGTEWVTVYDAKTLNGKIESNARRETSMSMGNVTASQIRITFIGATPSLYEIECSGTRLATTEYEYRYTKEEVLKLLEQLDSTDLSGFIPAYLEAVKGYRDAAMRTISAQTSTGDDITLVAKNLKNAISMIENNAFDLLIPEDNINNGSEIIKDVVYSVSGGASEPDVIITDGVGGKDASDKVYHVIDKDSYINLAGAKSLGNAYSLEYDILLGDSDSCMHTQMGWYVDVEDNNMRYFTVVKIGSDGVTLTKTAANGLTEVFESVDGNPVTEGYVIDGTIRVGEWNRIALVTINDPSTGYVKGFKLYVNGNEHTILFKEEFKYKTASAGSYTTDTADTKHDIIGIATVRLYYDRNKNDNPNLYLDNVIIKITETSAYNPDRDVKPTITVTNEDNWTLGGSTLLMKTSSRTVSELRADLCRNIRVLRDGVLLEAHELVQKGDVVVVYTTNGKDYERAYSYYTVDKRVPTFDNLKDGDEALGVYKDEALYVSTVGGVGGKLQDDLAYLISGFNTAGAFIPFDDFVTTDVFTLEHNVLIGNSTTLFRYQFSFFNDTNTAFPFINVKSDGVYLSNSNGGGAANAGIVESIDGIAFSEYPNGYKLADGLRVGEWYKIAIVVTSDADGYLSEIQFFINGECHTIKLVSGIYTPRYMRLVYDQSTNTALYLDNLLTRKEALFASYSSAQDIPITKDGRYGTLVTADHAAYIYKEGFTVKDVKALLGDVRVIREGSLLRDSATIANGDVIVTYSRGGAPFEVAYAYYTVSGYENSLYFDGTSSLDIVAGTAPVTFDNAGVAGKLTSDKVYHVYGATTEGTGYARLFQNNFSDSALGLNHKYSMNLLLNNADSGVQIRFGIFPNANDFREIVFYIRNNGIYLTTSLSGSITKINGVDYTSGTVKVADALSIGEWHDIGVYAVAGESGYITGMVLSIDGAEYEIVIANGSVHSLRHLRLYWNTSDNSDIYVDNVAYANNVDNIYSPSEQAAPTISIPSSIGTYSGGILELNDKTLTVAMLKGMIGENVRVYRNYHSTPVLLTDSDVLTNGDIVVAFASNNSGYERAYSYACVMIAKQTFAPLSQNMTLHSSFTMNVYIPTYIDITVNRLYLNGVALTDDEIARILARKTVLDDGIEYYVYSISVEPGSAADTFEITMHSGAITASGEELYYGWSTSIPNQVAIVLAGNYPDSAKQMMVDLIEYVKAFYTYIGKEIPSSLNIDYGRFTPTASASMGDEICTVSEFPGIKAACVNLSAMPRFRFIFEEGFTAERISINGQPCTLIEGTNERGESAVYVQSGISMHEFSDRVSLTIDGVTKYYNLSAYYGGIDSESARTLVMCLYNYSQSAKNYYKEYVNS